MPDEPETTTAVAVRQTEPNPMAMLATALDRGLAPDQLGKLYDLAERHEKNLAAQEFARAITAFQADCPAIPKGRPVKNRAGQETYKFANYDDISDVIAPLLAKHGIVVTFDSMPVEGMLLVTCRVRVGTHTEASGATVPIPAAGQMTNETQSLGSALSYGKRYAIGLALNIRFTGEDDDGHSSNGKRPQRQAQPQQRPPSSDDLAPKKPADDMTLTEILARMHKSAPADAADLCVRLKWLAGALARRLPDFGESELFDCIEAEVVMPDSGRMADLSPSQCGPAWAAVKVYVEQAAKAAGKAVAS